MSKKTHDDRSILSDLRPLVRKLAKARKHAETMGLFTHGRELLECTCGLVEDVAFDGKLFTYHKNDHGFKDTGLGFIKVNENTFRCPVCGTELKAVNL